VEINIVNDDRGLTIVSSFVLSVMKNKQNINNKSDTGQWDNFGSFYNAYYHRFYRYAYYYVSDRQTAEDMTHDAILYYWEHKNEIAPETDVLGYILLTIKNKCLNYLKHLKVEATFSKQYVNLKEWEIKARMTTLEDSEYADIFSREIMDIVTGALAQLPRQTRYIFIQNRFRNKSRKEIAAEMGVSLQKIDYHINKTNDHLYRSLKDYLPFIAFFLRIF
jgi:RNA polymerase sigma-70 factor (ECF subfamily)